MPKFKSGESRNQIALFPPTIDEYIPEDHLSRLVLSIVSSLNLKKFTDKFSGRGQRPYSPATLISILFYGYSTGIRSSRKLSMACEERLDFIYLTGKLKPSYKTISEFRRENSSKLSDLFQEIVLIGMKLGIVKIGNLNISIDGSKIRANASGKLSKDEKGLRKLLLYVKEKVAAVMKEANEIDNKEDLEYGNKRGDELPKALKKLEHREQKIKAAIEQLKQEKELLRQETIAKRLKEGKTKKLTKKEEQRIANKKINITDQDAQFMKQRSGCIKTNYNAQISVDEEDQFIAACDVTCDCNDKKQLLPMFELF